MKKNILLLLPLISTASAFSMEKYNPLMETVMNFTPMVNDESLGLWRSGSDLLYEPDNLYADLNTGKYNPLNKNYIEKLDRTIDTFARTNDPRLPETMNLCRTKYKGQVKIREEVALAAHICLTNEIKAKLSDLTTALETNDKKFLEEQNKLIAALKDSLAKQITLINTNLENHKKSRDTLLQQQGDTIRNNKKAALVTHKLSPTFKVPKDGYCSDEEQNPDDIANFYNDQHLLEKMNIDESTYATVNKTELALKSLTDINSALQLIQALRYQ